MPTRSRAATTGFIKMRPICRSNLNLRRALSATLGGHVSDDSRMITQVQQSPDRIAGQVACSSPWRARRRRITRGTAAFTSPTRSSAINGPDLLFVPIRNFPIDLVWDEPTVARPPPPPGVVQSPDPDRPARRRAAPISTPSRSTRRCRSWTDGLVAVLDAVGSERASIFAMAESTLSCHAAGREPSAAGALARALEPVRALSSIDSDQPFGMPGVAARRSTSTAFGRHVGTGAVVDVLAPSWADDAAKRRWWARCERLAGGPGVFHVRCSTCSLRTDVRPVLDSIQAPTLVLRRRGDRHVRCGHAQTIARADPGMRGWWSSTATTACGSPATPTACWTRSSRFSPANAVRHRRTACCRPCCSPTSWSRPNAPRRLGDDAWTDVLAAHDRIVESAREPPGAARS